MTPKERSLRSRIAAHSLHSMYDSEVLTRPARAKFMARFEGQVDPDGILPEAERRRRADHALIAYMSALSLKAARARTAKAQHRTAAPLT